MGLANSILPVHPLQNAAVSQRRSEPTNIFICILSKLSDPREQSPEEQSASVELAMLMLQQLGVPLQLTPPSAENGDQSVPGTVQVNEPNVADKTNTLQLLTELKQLISRIGNSEASPAQHSALSTLQAILQDVDQTSFTDNDAEKVLSILNQTSTSDKKLITNQHNLVSNSQKSAIQNRSNHFLLDEVSEVNNQGPSSNVQVQQSQQIRPNSSVWMHVLKTRSSSDVGVRHDEMGSPQLNNPGVLGVQQSSDSMVAETTIDNHQVPVDHFAARLNELITNHVQLSDTNASRVFKITLVPEGLGQIQVVLRGRSKQNELSIEFIADSSSTKHLLDTSLSSLRTDLQNQGVNLSKIEVTLAHTSDFISQHSGFFQQEQQSGGQWTSQDQKKKKYETETIDRFDLDQNGLSIATSGDLSSGINLTA